MGKGLGNIFVALSHPFTYSQQLAEAYIMLRLNQQTGYSFYPVLISMSEAFSIPFTLIKFLLHKALSD